MSPSEIESILQEHPEVKESLVFGKKDPKVQEILGKREIEWKFTPVKAPRFGAVYERLIGIMKKLKSL